MADQEWDILVYYILVYTSIEVLLDTLVYTRGPTPTPDDTKTRLGAVYYMRKSFEGRAIPPRHLSPNYRQRGQNVSLSRYLPHISDVTKAKIAVHVLCLMGVGIMALNVALWGGFTNVSKASAQTAHKAVPTKVSTPTSKPAYTQDQARTVAIDFAANVLSASYSTACSFATPPVGDCSAGLKKVFKGYKLTTGTIGTNVGVLADGYTFYFQANHGQAQLRWAESVELVKNQLKVTKVGQ